MLTSERAPQWIAAFKKELDTLGSLGVITHLHTREECEDIGVCFTTEKPLSTLVVNEYKWKTDEHTADNADHKSRMVVEGQNMIKGVHFKDSHAHTPKMETNRIMSALSVLYNLVRKAFDVSSAYCLADQEKPLALRYPRGMPQYDPEGRQLFMLLRKNTYGKKDGGNLWQQARDEFLLTEFNQAGWMCKPMKADPCLFKVSVGTEFLLVDVHTNDFDLASAHEAMMDCFIECVQSRWKIKMTNVGYVLGVTQTLTV